VAKLLTVARAETEVYELGGIRRLVWSVFAALAPAKGCDNRLHRASWVSGAQFYDGKLSAISRSVG
jgi:hypothetical protein